MKFKHTHKDFRDGKYKDWFHVAGRKWLVTVSRSTVPHPPFRQSFSIMNHNVAASWSIRGYSLHMIAEWKSR